MTYFGLFIGVDDNDYSREISEQSKRLASSSNNSNKGRGYIVDEEESVEEERDKGHSKSTNCEEKALSTSSKEYIGAHSFTAHELLGTGSFGEVYLVEKISDNTLHAMKVL